MMSCDDRRDDVMLDRLICAVRWSRCAVRRSLVRAIMELSRCAIDRWRSKLICAEAIHPITKLSAVLVKVVGRLLRKWAIVE